MTRDEIVNYITGKLGITDATAKAQAVSCVQARWLMIWDEENWRQARVQTTLAVTAGTQDVTLPTEFEFATGARWSNGTELLALDDAAALALNPSGYDQPGTVLNFIPLPKDSSGNAQLRLLQIPTSDDNLLVIGKRKCPQLTNPTDTPMIPGASQALCELTLGDLFEWIRQFTKAQACFQRGALFVQKMKDIETAQSAEIRRIIPIEQSLDSDPAAWLS